MDADHKDRSKFAKLTAHEERTGLRDKTSTIGTRGEGWRWYSARMARGYKGTGSSHGEVV